MSQHRRATAPTTRLAVALRTAFVLLALFATALVAGAGAAGAAPYSGAPTLSISASDPCRHATLTADGAGFTPGQTIVLRIGGTVLATVTVARGAAGFTDAAPLASTGADGTFHVSMTLPPQMVGPATIVADGGRGNTASTTIDIQADCVDGVAASAAASHPAGAGSGPAAGTDGLSSTGVAVLGLLVLAVALMAAGTVLLAGGRRRRAA